MLDLIMSMDSDHTGWGEDLIICVTVEPLCSVFGTNIRLYSNDSLIKIIIIIKIKMLVNSIVSKLLQRNIAKW